MKSSKYNFFIPYKDRVICFNGISGKVFSVSKEHEFDDIKQYIETPIGKNNVTDFLVQNKFIIEDSMDELEFLKTNNRRSIFDNSYHLIINPTLECNFKCWYCYEKAVVGRMSDHTMKKIKNLIKNITSEENIDELIISWFGGEPMLYFCQVIYPISLFARNVCEKNNVKFETNMTTNGFLFSRERIQMLREIKMMRFQITIDGNKKTHNKVRNQNGKPSFDEIVNNIISICTYIPNIHITLRINYTNEILKQDIGETLSLFPKQIRKNIRVDFQRVWQTEGERNAVELLRNIDLASDMGFAPALCGEYSIHRYHRCYADRFNFAHINFDGKVYRCTARDYSQRYECGELSEAGEIIWNTKINELMFSKSNFDNEKCLSCKLLPICVGPCYQNYRDYKEGKSSAFCFEGNNEIDVNTFIVRYYLTVKKICRERQDAISPLLY